MATGFAGSRVVDERRRRRMATEQDNGIDGSQTGDSFSPGLLNSAPPTDSAEAPDECDSSAALFPIHRFVPGSVGLVLTIVMGIAAVTAAFGYLAHTPSRLSIGLADPIADRITATIERIDQLWQAGLWFLLAGFAVVIRWGRSHSIGDFAGTYRGWTPIAYTFLIVGLFVYGDGSALLSETLVLIERTGAVTGWEAHRPILYVMPVVILWGAALWSILSRELKGSGLATAWLSLAAITGLLTVTWKLIGGGLPEPLGSFAAIWGPQLPRLLVVCLFAAILHELRHVIHISPEPSSILRPDSRSDQAIETDDDTEPEAVTETVAESEPQKEVLRTGRKRKVARRTEPVTETAPPEEPTPVPSEPEPKSKRKSRRKSAATASKPTPEPKETPVAETTAVDPEPIEPADEPKSPPIERVDGPDPELLKGLSKRERRRVRKEWRDRQRAMTTP